MPPKTNVHLPKNLSLFIHPDRPRYYTNTSESTQLSGFDSVYSPLSKALRFFARTGLLVEGKRVQALLIKLGLCNSLALQNQVLNFYMKCKEFMDAHKLFDEMRVRNVVTWNTVICGLVSNCSDFEENVVMAFSYFRRMLMDKAGLDHITLNGLLRTCVELNDIEEGKQLHCYVIKLGFEFDCFVNSAVVDLYGKCGFVKEARRVFDGVVCRDLVMWNVMLSCYAFNGLAEEAFAVFNLMHRERTLGDAFTYSSILNACGTLGSYVLGRQIHCHVVKLCFGLDILVASGLVDVFSKSEHIGDARKVFDGMAARNVVSWNTMVVGYDQIGEWKEAMELLQEMFGEGFYPDELTLASILSSCGRASAICEIMHVHAYVVKVGFHGFLSVVNALINAYSKCGRIASAFLCFNSVSIPDLLTWTSLIFAYAYNGLPKNGIEIFEEMLSTGVRPDGISFLGILSACSHAGLVKEGLHYFKLMTKGYQIWPGLEHYNCLVDLLGRAGLLDEALNIIASIPVGQGSDTLGAFIGACKVHGHPKLAKWAAEKLLDIEPHESVNYTLMSNIYATEAQWGQVARLRRVMRDRCHNKVLGCSWMEAAGSVNTFASGDKSHPEAV